MERVALWHISIFGIVVAAVALVLQNDTSDLLVVGWSAFCALGVGGAAVRLHGRAKLIYGALFLSGVLMISGAIVRSLHGDAIGVDQPLPSYADFLHIPAYLLFASVVLAVHRIRASRRDVDAWLDASSLTLAGILLYWGGFLATYLTSTQGAVEVFLSTFYNAVVFLALALLLRIGASPGERPASYFLLGAGGASFVVADLAGAVSDAQGASLFLTLALSPIAYGFVLGAAWHPSAIEISATPKVTEEPIGLFRFSASAIAISTPAIVAFFPATRDSVGRVGTILLSGALGIVLVARIIRLLLLQRSVTAMESRLVETLSNLATLETTQDLARELPRASAHIFGGETTLKFTADKSDRSVPASSTLSGDGHVLHATLEPPSNDPARERIFAGFIRDAEAIASARSAIELQARQKSEAEANKRIAANERRFRALVQNASDVVLVMGRDGVVSYVSEAAENVIGYPPTDFVGKTLEWIHHENDWNFARDYLRAVLNGTSSDHTHEIRAIHADGSIRLLECVMTNMENIEGVEGIVVNITDSTRRRLLESNLRDAETIDPLTMQLNRTAFIREADAALRRSSVSESSVALAIINIDDFRMINEGFGTNVADELLVELAHRVRQAVRLDDSVARLNGDEFGILMPNGYSVFEAERALERILNDLTAPVSVSGRKIAVRATAGLVLNNDGSSTGIGMLRDADTALDTAKKTARGSFVLFDEAMGEEISERVELRNLLHDAITTSKLRLAFQPIVDMETGKIVSMEALSRWHDQSRGDIGPSTFIPIAEATGMISELGEWALRTACQRVVEWAEQGFDDFSVSVNMSGHQLREESVIATVKAILDETGVDPARITIEITESVLIDDTDFIAHRISALRDLGVRLAIDDFGTGYSSLSYLRRYEFDVLKVDRSFVIPLANDANKKEREIVNAMIKLAQALGAVTVAEGIEEPEEYAVLRTLGCDHAQGYLFWYPLEVEDVLGALTSDPSKSIAA